MKNFNRIYEQVLINSKEELESLRKSLLLRIVLCIIFAGCLIGITLMYTHGVVLGLVMFLAIAVCVFIVSKPGQEYKSVYKEKVVKTFVEAYDENLAYLPTGRVSEYLYMSAGFERYCDRYSSEDLITGNIDGHKIMMGEVHTERRETYTDSDGHTQTRYVTIFHGMFGNVEISSKYNGQIRVHSDKGMLGKIFGNQKRIEMDSTEFEKYFEVHADDKIQAMQVLTSDIMEEMIDFIKKSKIRFELTINHNQLFIRFKTGDIFEGNVFRSSVNFDTLKKMFDIINFTFDITRKLIKVTEETAI